MTLSDMKIGDSGIVASVNASDNIKRRLLDIGLIKGTKVECVLKSPFNDPVAYLIRGTIIALRKEDSKNIVVSL